MLNINFLNKHVIFRERKDLETNHRGRELIPSPSCDLKRKFSEEEIGISIIWLYFMGKNTSLPKNMIYKPKKEKKKKEIEIRKIALIKIQISYFPTKKNLNSFK